MTAVVTGFAVAVTCAAPDATADIWKVTGLSVAPGTVDLPDTSKVTVKCSFKMTLNEPDKDDLQVTISDNGNIKSFVNVSNGQWQGDSHKTTYSIGGGGVHAIKCALKSIDLATLKGKITDEKSETYGFDAQTEKYVDMVAAGIIDPAKVVRTALQDAGSVAGLLVTTEAMVAELPKEPAPAMPPGGGMGGGMGF
jgi:hypothetical protein